MNRSDQAWDYPGIGAAVETFENEFRWGSWPLTILTGFTIDGAARDAGASPTSVLRKGLLLGQITSSGNLKEFTDGATDGSEVVFGVLAVSLRVVDLDGSNKGKFCPVAIAGPIQSLKLFGLTEKARAQMAGRFLFDDRQYRPMAPQMWVTPKSASYTVVNGTDNGKTFTTEGASGAVTFTLPTTLMAGQSWTFLNTVGQTMAVAAPAGKLITFNNAAATSVTFSTAGNLIGAAVRITVNSDATKYIATPMGAQTMTVA